MFSEILNLSLDNSPVRIKENTPETKKYRNVDYHNHDETELLYITDGILICYPLDGEKYTLKKGDIVVFRGGFYHKTVFNTQGTAYYTLQFSLKFFMDIVNSFLGLYSYYNTKDYAFYNISSDVGEKLSKIISEIYHTNKNKESGSSEIIVGKVCELIGLLINDEFINVIDVKSGQITDTVIKSIAFINDNYKERVTPDVVAKSVNLNVDYLGRIFKKQTGKTLMEYLNYTRITEAKNLLVNTDKSITDISMETGFSSLSYFTRVFKEYTHTSPSRYRKIKLTDEKHTEIKGTE